MEWVVMRVSIYRTFRRGTYRATMDVFYIFINLCWRQLICFNYWLLILSGISLILFFFLWIWGLPLDRTIAPKNKSIKLCIIIKHLIIIILIIKLLWNGSFLDRSDIISTAHQSTRKSSWKSSVFWCRLLWWSWKSILFDFFTFIFSTTEVILNSFNISGLFVLPVLLSLSLQSLYVLPNNKQFKKISLQINLTKISPILLSLICRYGIHFLELTEYYNIKYRIMFFVLFFNSFMFYKS